MRCKTLAVLVLAPLVVTGCPRDRTDEGLTRAEASQALEEIRSNRLAIARFNTIEFVRRSHSASRRGAAEEISSFVQRSSLRGSSGCQGHGDVEYAAKGSTVLQWSRHHGNESYHRRQDGSGVVVWIISGRPIQRYRAIDGTATVTWSSVTRAATCTLFGD
jgi:hypothetical protein